MEITEARMRANLSRAELARLLEVSETTIWRWETGKALPTRRLVRALWEELGKRR